MLPAPCAAGDTPESVELNGMKNLLAAVGGQLSGTGSRLLFSPDGRGAVQGWGRWVEPGRPGAEGAGKQGCRQGFQCLSTID